MTSSTWRSTATFARPIRPAKTLWTIFSQMMMTPMSLIGILAVGCTRISPPHRQWWKRRLSNHRSPLNEKDCHIHEALGRRAFGIRSTSRRTGTWIQYVHLSTPKSFGIAFVCLCLPFELLSLKQKKKMVSGRWGARCSREAWSSIGAFGAWGF